LADIEPRWYIIAMLRAAIALVAMTACTASSDRPPVARIAAMPAAIPEGDDFATSVVLDGTASAAIDDPSAELAFAWQLLDDGARADDLHQPTVTAQFAGARPPRVVLTVTEPGGAAGDVVRELELTVLPSP
jgi:hypothetical protein